MLREWKLADLARETRGYDKPSFQKRYPDPVLVFLAPEGKTDESNATELPPEGLLCTDIFVATTDLGDTAVDDGSSGPRGRFQAIGDSTVIFLTPREEDSAKFDVTVGRG